MKLSELKAAVDAAMESNIGTPDASVVVVMAEGGIPTRPMVAVKSAHIGFDWTHGKFLIHTEQPVVRKKVK